MRDCTRRRFSHAGATTKQNNPALGAQNINCNTMKNPVTRARQSLGPVLATLAIFLLALGTPSLWAVPNANPGIIKVQANAYGKSYGEWAAAWWTWALETPASINPVSDSTGEFCHINQSGPVWFLAGNFGGTTVRQCTIPAGKALFFPIVNSFYGFLPFEEVDLQLARDYNQQQIDSASNLACEIDGVPVANLAAYREQSSIFRVVLPEDNVFGVPEWGGLAVDSTVDEGIYLLVTPLRSGSHTVHIHACMNNCGFELDVTYHLTVQ